MAKLKRKPARAEKRARNKARREKGLTSGRGSRRTRMDPGQLVLMGKGMAQSFVPYRGER